MIEYLQNHPNVLLANVALLNMIATLLPNLSRRIITILVEVIDIIMGQHSDDCESIVYNGNSLIHIDELSGILAALKAFPLNGGQSCAGQSVGAHPFRCSIGRESARTRSMVPR